MTSVLFFVVPFVLAVLLIAWAEWEIERERPGKGWQPDPKDPFTERWMG